jgi:hypothetical protein
MSNFPLNDREFDESVLKQIKGDREDFTAGKSLEILFMRIG